MSIATAIKRVAGLIDVFNEKGHPLFTASAEGAEVIGQTSETVSIKRPYGVVDMYDERGQLIATYSV